MSIKKLKIAFIAIVAFLLIISMAACGNDEPATSPEAAPEDTPAVEVNPTPEPEPVPEQPSPWKRVDVLGMLSVEVNENWIRSDDGDRTNFYFNEGSGLPVFAFYGDYVSGFSGDTDEGFDEFFEWWLAERFHSQGYDVVSEEFVTNNGVRGVEIIYYSTDDETGKEISRHCIYTIIETTYIALTFSFEKDGESPYLDDVRHVFDSIIRIEVSLYEWPAAYLPEDTPKYPEGDFDVYISSAAVGIFVNNTSEDTLSEYVDLLTKAGWEIEPFDPVRIEWVGARGSWEFIGQTREDGTIAIFFYF